MRTEAEVLLRFTKGARDDFHEPDEQGITLVDVVGTSLDNCFGNAIISQAVSRGYQEAVVILKRLAPNGAEVERFNLATLIALARIGAKTITETHKV